MYSPVEKCFYFSEIIEPHRKLLHSADYWSKRTLASFPLTPNQINLFIELETMRKQPLIGPSARYDFFSLATQAAGRAGLDKPDSVPKRLVFFSTFCADCQTSTIQAWLAGLWNRKIFTNQQNFENRRLEDLLMRKMTKKCDKLNFLVNIFCGFLYLLHPQALQNTLGV